MFETAIRSPAWLKKLRPYSGWATMLGGYREIVWWLTLRSRSWRKHMFSVALLVPPQQGDRVFFYRRDVTPVWYKLLNIYV